MKTIRVHVLVAMTLVLFGLAGLIHTALEQSAAQTIPAHVVDIEHELRAVEAEISKLGHSTIVTTQSNSDGSNHAPVAPAPPTPPTTPFAPVNNVVWLALTLACFAPFAVAGWYLDRRSNSIIFEQPLA